MVQTLRTRQETLAESWREGLSGQEILCRSAALVDVYVADRFDCAQAVRQAEGAIAVVALGGYGRQELYPYSDIDLLLLHDRRSKKSMQEVAEALLYPLWDEGFEVGHSVRGVKDAIQFALNDFHFRVSLLDARLIAGSPALFDELRACYAQQVLDGRRLDFVRTMDAFKQERWRKFGSHAYLLEPHVKEGKGGLRDIQAMGWVAKGVFGLQDLDAIQSSGMLEAENRQAFESAWSMLLKIRNRLHLLCRRKNDHLIFEYQQEVAQAFDYRDSEGMLGVEHFMRDLYGHLQTVSVVTDLFFEHVHEVLGLTVGSAPEQQLERGIVLRGGTVRLASLEELTARPLLLMRLFLQAGRAGAPLHHRTRQSVASHLSLVDDRFRASKRVAKAFFELLTQVEPIFPVLEAMLATGLLTRYLPEFAGVESLAQHDLYHLYTVDRHQLQTVAELKALQREQPELFAEVGLPEVLYLAALLHDIGKGRRADHSVLGAEITAGIGARLHLAQEECATLAFLVRHHLYLPENALRRDFSDRAFIRQAAELIGNTERLTMLYLLTIADSKATGPSAWSDWKASLLTELYLSLKACLGAECHLRRFDREEEAQGVSWLREQLLVQLDGEPVRMNVQSLPADYLLSYSLPAVLHHLRVHADRAARLSQQVLLFPEAGERFWSLLIMGQDRLGLLAKFCGVLALHHLRVLSAQIFTWPDGTVVDTLEVAPAIQRNFDEMDWPEVERDLNLAVNYRLDVGYQLHARSYLQQYGPNRPVQQLERKVVVDNRTSQPYTIIEVHGSDHRGALYQLTQTLADFGLSIHRARIATEVEQLIDVFYVKTGTGDKLTDGAAIDRVRATLMQVIGEDTALAA
ncbi:MAG: [protein-PII] uridylyltransferase [Desulfobulbus sp.]|jgi:[protein-PII] uridylyltransferase|uniref:[protein-PII] uridylyltransferase n=1 Tax=Desulfobulbus sp. TaxID=895 RepID=UPI00283EDDC4|nr:[protein-PII] uridylyltransferase [Desulfobulbus sp.]MDR2549408.1 [protein-PII] uridylyltransferase [Desulfobulbus sp.]